MDLKSVQIWLATGLRRNHGIDIVEMGPGSTRHRQDDAPNHNAGEVINMESGFKRKVINLQRLF